jgi:hypothetical protein
MDNDGGYWQPGGQVYMTDPACNAAVTCDWQQITCATGVNAGKMYYICGPSTCTGGACTKGTDKYVDNAACVCTWQSGTCGIGSNVGKRLFTCGPTSSGCTSACMDNDGGYWQPGGQLYMTDPACNAAVTCDWQKITCGTGSHAGKMYYICGPSTCTGTCGGSAKGAEKYVDDSTCGTCSWQSGDCGTGANLGKRLHTCGPTGCSGTCLDNDGGTWQPGGQLYMTDTTCSADVLCAWQEISCGTESHIGEKYYICGPSTCTGTCGGSAKGAEKYETDSACVLCGNGQLDSGEECDGLNVNGKTCQTVPGRNFTGGNLACSSLCNFDLTACTSGTSNGITISLRNPLKCPDGENCTIQTLIDRLINFIFTLGIVLTPLFYILSGFYFVTAAGEPQKVTTAKNIALYTTIGLGIILFAKGLISVLKSVIGG